MRQIGVIGIGNIEMGDDGIAPRLIQRLEASGNPGEALRLVDAGTGGMAIVHELARLDIAIIVDAGDFGGRPGEFRIFTPQEAVSLKPISGLCTHEFDLLKAIELSGIMKELPQQVHIMAIQPETIAATQQLSAPLEARMPEYEAVLRKLLEKACREKAD